MFGTDHIVVALKIFMSVHDSVKSAVIMFIPVGSVKWKQLSKMNKKGVN